MRNANYVVQIKLSVLYRSHGVLELLSSYGWCYKLHLSPDFVIHAIIAIYQGARVRYLFPSVYKDP